MRSEQEIETVILNAKAWFTKVVQDIATILEARLLNEEEQILEKKLQTISVAIQSIENGYLTLEQKNTMADFIVEQSQIGYRVGQSYVENNYTENEYVVFNQ